jgi:hypothetical protein
VPPDTGETTRKRPSRKRPTAAKDLPLVDCRDLYFNTLISFISFIVIASFVHTTDRHEILVFVDTTGGIPPSGDVPTMPK